MNDGGCGGGDGDDDASSLDDDTKKCRDDFISSLEVMAARHDRNRNDSLGGASSSCV